MFSLLKRLWAHITTRRRLQFLALFVLMIIAAFAEIMSLGAVLPFLGLLTSPEKVFTHPLAQYIIEPLGLQSAEEMLLPITLIFSAAAFLSGAMRLLLLLVQTKLGHAIGSEFSVGMYKRTLYQSYSVHISRNSSELISGITSKAKVIVGSTIIPLMTIVSSSILLGAILITLFKIQTTVTIIAFSGFGLLYALLVLSTRRRLLNRSRQISIGHVQQLQLLQEGLGGIRDVLLDGSQEERCKAFEAVDTPLRKAVADVQILSVSPRYVVEALGMVLIAVLAYFLTEGTEENVSTIPVLGALVMGAQRMLPLLQQIYSGWTLMRGSQVSLNDALDLMDQPLPEQRPEHPKFEFNRSIELRNVSFKFTDDTPHILSGLNIKLDKGKHIGIIGTTGSGKSTLLDIIMGLLTPTNGHLLVDGTAVTKENQRGWQKRIAHVPQAIYLSDASIGENIALGALSGEIDYERVRESAQRAQIADFIDGLDQKYETLAGERGVKLSGGQRQRIGIARALYKGADLLVLDEATSALDNQAESRVMKAIESVGSSVTTIIVAHRLTTLRSCDFIIELAAGKVVRVGTYDEIVGA